MTVTGGAPTVSQDYSSFPDLMKDVLNAHGSFVSFWATHFNANITFLGVANALQANSDINGTTVGLVIPITGFTRTFTGPTRSNVEQQIQDFFLQSGTVWSVTSSRPSPSNPPWP